MHISVVTLFEDFFDSPLSLSIPARAIEQGHATVDFTDPRSFATNRHQTVDDSPYGGGAGMVMRAAELDAALEHLTTEESAEDARPVVLLSPQGRRFNHEYAQGLASGRGVILVCGRYEGVDERFIDKWVDAELSVGDYVLSGGEPAAMIVIDSVLRLLPGVLGNEESLDEESFSGARLEAPHFTRPRQWEGRGVPPVLLSGDHGRVARWRKKVSVLRTLERRPDMVEQCPLSEGEQKLLADKSLEVPSWLVKTRNFQSGS